MVLFVLNFDWPMHKLRISRWPIRGRVPAVLELLLEDQWLPQVLRGLKRAMMPLLPGGGTPRVYPYLETRTELLQSHDASPARRWYPSSVPWVPVPRNKNSTV